MKNNNFEKFEVKNSRFFIKNLIIFLIPVILPVLTLGLFSIYITQEYLQENIDVHNQNILVQAKNQVENVFKETESIYHSLISNPEINNNLKRILESKNLSPDDYKLIRFLNNSLSSQAKSRDYIHSIYIYFENNQGTFLSSNQGLSYQNNFFDTSWKKEYNNRKEKDHKWMTYRRIYPEGHNNPADEVFSLYWINRNNGLSEGTVVLNIYSEYLKNILASFDTLEEQKLIVVDNEDNLLFSNERLSYLDKMNTLYKLRVNDEQTIIDQENSELFDWNYYSIVPEDIIYAAPIEITKILIFLLIFLVFLGLFVSYYLTKKNYNRITNIIEIINHAEAGEELPEIDDATDDEYGYITREIIETFIQNSYLKLQMSERNYKQKTLELLALQSQINPHFLYNTLETIYWKVFQFTGSTNVTTKMIENLSDILKYSLHSPRKKVTIKEEIKHTKSYLEIQKIRFKDSFNIKWEYDSGLIDNLIIKLILQPLVENAIHYGISEKNDNGEIKIKITESKVKDKIKISIIDNGVGFNKQRLMEVKDALLEGKTGGDNIGLRNTNKRLILMYGEESRLHIRSKKDFGTVVYFYIPQERE